jgi:tetratricopeptide (TPR) repeat protein
VRLDLGLHQLAIADFEAAIRINTCYAEAWCNRGTARAALGELEGAAEDCNRALTLEPDCAAFHAFLGAVLESQNKVAAAIRESKPSR